MSDRRSRPNVIGLRSSRGGAVAVAIAVEAGGPRLIVSTRIETHAPGDRLTLEPYHLATEMPRGPDGKATAEAQQLVATARSRQAALASESLRALVGRLSDMDGGPPMAALLVNRAGWVTDLLDYSLGWSEHAAVAEGLAVRDALRSGLRANGLAMIDLDEKTLPDRAPSALGLVPGAIEATLKALGTTAGKPWRKEQKLACLAAWVAGVGEQ